MTDSDDKRVPTLAVHRFGPDIDKAFPVSGDLDKTLRYWTPEDFRRQDNMGGHTIAAAMERQGVRRLGDLFGDTL